MNHCTQCGSGLAEGALFCPECGTPVAAAVAPVAEPVAPVAPVAEPVAPAEPRSGRRVVAVAVAVALLAGGGFFGFKALVGRGAGGASSAKGAVEGLSKAISARDPLAAVAMVAPAQVRHVDDLYAALRAKAKKAGVVGDNPFAGLDVGVEGLTLTETKLSDSAVAVTVTAGSVRYSIKPDELAPGLRSKANPEAGTVALADVARDAIGVDAPIITIKQNGRWYVSPADTALEWFRRANSYPPADFTRKPGKSTGASSPAGVVTALSEAVTRLDLSRLLDLASPDELGALYHYRSAILAGVDDEGLLSDIGAAGSISFDDIKTTVKDKRDDSARVVITSVSGTVTETNVGVTRFTAEDGCLSLRSSDGETDRGCVDSALDELGWGSGADRALSRGLKEISLDVVKVDGRWYLSPVTTVMRVLRGAVAAANSKDLLSAISAEHLAPSEGTLSTTPTTGRFTADVNFHVYDLEVPAGGYYRVCAPDVSTGGYEPDGTPSTYVTDDIYLAKSAGKHKVLVRGSEGNEYAVAAVAITPKTGRVGTVMSGSVSESTCAADLYTVPVTAGRALYAQGTGNPQLVAPDGSTLSGAPIFQPSTSGTHVAVFNAGSYATTFVAVPPNAVAAGSSISGSVSGGPSSYSLYVSAGQSLTIAVNGGDSFDTTLTLLTRSGTQLAFNDDSSAGRDPVLQYTFSTGGIYVLRISGYNNGSGTFTLQVS